jgi:thioredoxin reductase (NADPH)
MQFDLRVNTYEPVVGIEMTDGEFLLTTQYRGGERGCRAKRMVLATGGTDRPRRLNIAGEDLPHVSHYFRDPHSYFRRRLLVVGGKNSAVEAALRCHHAGAQVSLSYRQGELGSSIKYWLLPEMNDLLRSGRIGPYFHTTPTGITPAEVMLRSTLDGGERTVASDFVLLLTGYEQDNSLLKLAGIDLAGECGSPRFDERTMETNVPGLYVAGTAVAGTQDKYRVFIENCHVHVGRIMAALTGAAAPGAPRAEALPES